MRTRLSVLFAAIVLVYGNTVLAREGGGGHDSHRGAIDAGQQQGNAGGTASEHMGQQGIENSNAQWSTGATKGQERSDLRNQDHGKYGHEAGVKHRNVDEGKHKGHEHVAGDKSDKYNKKQQKNKGSEGHKGKSGHGSNYNGHEGHSKRGGAH